MKRDTKARARQLRERLLALPDETLVRTVEQWGMLLRQFTSDLEELEEALIAIGLQFRSLDTGRVYPSLGDLMVAEPTFGRCAFVVADVRELRRAYQIMPIREFYHTFLPLAEFSSLLPIELTDGEKRYPLPFEKMM